MLKMKRKLFGIFLPFTIFVVPHNRKNTLKVKIPLGLMLAIILLAFTGSFWIVSKAVDMVEYNCMKKKVTHLSTQFNELKPVMASLKRSENEFRKIFSLKTKQDVILAIDEMDENGIENITDLKKQIASTMESVSKIRQYLNKARDVYFATPSGFPVEGHITSPFGLREHPKSGKMAHHSGVDIAASVGTPVKSTAEGIVSFAGYFPKGGNVVVIEHGSGMSTAYAHNKSIKVKVGDEVKKGQVIAISGETGSVTGPHVHYEIWKNGTRVNPAPYMRGDLYVWKKTSGD